MSRIQNSYDNTFDVLSGVYTNDDGALKLNDSPTEVFTDQAGKLDLLNGTEVVTNERKETLANYRLFCDELAILNEYYILVNSKLMSIYSIDDTTLRGRNPHLELLLNYKDA